MESIVARDTDNIRDLPAEPEPDAEEGAESSEVSGATHGKVSRGLGAQSELEIRQAVVAAVAHAVAFGAMKAALQLPVSPSASATVSRSATPPPRRAADNIIPAETIATRRAEVPSSSASSACATVRNPFGERKVPQARVPTSHLKMLAWCCK